MDRVISIFGGNLIFEAVDLLLFIVKAINALALIMFEFKYYKEDKDKIRQND